VSRAAPLLKYVPLLRSILGKTATAQNTEQTDSKPAPQATMDKAQAADILGVDVNASEEDIIAAHKRLIQKVHPDKGGSDALAVQINTAKKVLLS
jgi:hypothetical protein